MVTAGPVRRGLDETPGALCGGALRRSKDTHPGETRSGMTTTQLRAKFRAVPTGGLFFRLLTR
jgi:hypothetical protein